MKKIFLNFLTLIAIGVVLFLFRTPFLQIFTILKNKYLPCSVPITYSIGSFDKNFGISEEEFIRIVKIGESTWEKSINKELFTYVSDGKGDLKINLIYDSRQQATEKLKNIGIKVDNTKASYNDLKGRYSAMQADYLILKSEFESRVTLFKNRQDVYQKEVADLNAQGGASKEDFNRLNKEKNYLDTEFLAINNLQKDLNLKVENINALVIVLNGLVSSLNLEVNKFNTIGGQLGGEFEEGTYKENSTTREIDIYQFDNIGKLARVLTHEFGHALGLDHIENPKAVMYRLNNGVNEKLTTDDIKELKDKCKIK